MSQLVASWYLLDNNLRRNANKFNFKIFQSYLICCRYFTSINAILWITIIARNILSKNFISISQLWKNGVHFVLYAQYVIISIFQWMCQTRIFYVFTKFFFNLLSYSFVDVGLGMKECKTGRYFFIFIFFRSTLGQFLNQFQGFQV